MNLTSFLNIFLGNIIGLTTTYYLSKYNKIFEKAIQRYKYKFIFGAYLLFIICTAVFLIFSISNSSMYFLIIGVVFGFLYYIAGMTK